MRMDLRVNYQETITTGNLVREKGGDFQSLLEKIRTINTELKGYWEGQDAAKYTEAIENHAVTMKKLGETITEVGIFLGKVGKTYQETAEDNAGRAGRVQKEYE